MSARRQAQKRPWFWQCPFQRVFSVSSNPESNLDPRKNASSKTVFDATPSVAVMGVKRVEPRLRPNQSPTPEILVPYVTERSTRRWGA